MKKGLFALSPMVVFVLLYLVTSIIAGDFYKVPITVAFLSSSIYAIAITKGKLIRRINVFCRGAGDSQMMLMVWIFVLAGSEMKAVEATVNLTLSILPPQMLLAGLFVAACFISLSIGTSVGTIATLAPIAAGVAFETDCSLGLMTAVIVGGAFFGDNLSFISDTTIIATQTQGCKPADKFRVNSFIVAPAALLILLVYLCMGHGIIAPSGAHEVEYLKVLPYVVVLLTAILGLNVMVVLIIGCVLTGFVGIFTGAFDFYGWLGSMGDGIKSMGELIIITMLAGGLLGLIKHNGGIDFIIRSLSKPVHGKRGAELSIAALVSLVNLCTANNTVAIITVSSIVRSIGERFHLDARKCASLLDTFSCATQGLLPYGAQMLMAAVAVTEAVNKLQPEGGSP